jgi:uncharacterized protein (TIGR00288 family)
LSAGSGEQQFQYDVCLSFAGEDRAYVKQVADALQARGIRVFYDEYERSQLWGKNLYIHLDDVYRRMARYCIVFISEHYAEKLWTNHERESAQARAFSASEEYLLPVRFDDTAIPGIRPTTGYIDLRATSPEELAGLIAEKLGRIGRVAVFIDGDWLLGFARHIRVSVDFKGLIQALRTNFGTDTPVRIQLSDFGGSVQAARRITELETDGYLVDAVKTSGKNRVWASKGFDVRLAVRAAGLPEHFRTLVLLSGDSDFVPLIEQAKASGRNTVLIVCKSHASGALCEAADRVISLNNVLPGWRAT